MTLLETRLVRIDIPSCPTVCCSVYSNSSKIGTLTSLEYNDPGNCVLIPMQGNLRIVVSSTSGILGSVTFPFTLLNESGCLWLPVKPSGACDYIDTLPEELGSPKILLYFEKKSPEECEEVVDVLTETRSKLEIITDNYKEFVQKSKEREISLIKLLEEKENDLKGYVEELSKAQSRIFSLMAEKKHINDSLARMQTESSYLNISELKEELEITRQELLKSETRNEHLLRKLEDVGCEWDFLVEESKYMKESELLSQISQLKQELELKSKEIRLLTNSHPTHTNTVLSEVSNKLLDSDKFMVELTDTIKHSKPARLSASASTENLVSNSFNIESVQASMIYEDDSISKNSLTSQPLSRGISPGLKENSKKLGENSGIANKGSFRCPTISSQNKLRYIPISTSRRLNQSVERKIQSGSYK